MLQFAGDGIHEGGLARTPRSEDAQREARLARLDDRLTSLPRAKSGASLALQARGSILAISEALIEHASYFDAGARGLFGVYVAPMSLMMVAAWLVTIALRAAGSGSAGQRLASRRVL